MIFKLITNDRGLGVVEVLTSSIIILIIFTALTSFLVNTEKQIEDISKSSVANKNMIYIVQSILSNSKNYQFYPEDGNHFGVSISDSFTLEEKSTVFDKLAYAMNAKGEIKSVTICSDCNRRIGVSLVPIKSSNSRGLFKVWVLGMERIPSSGAGSESDSYRIFVDQEMILPVI